TLAIDEVTPTIHNNVEVSIFPNPNNGKGKLIVSGINDPYKIEIFDVGGKVVFSQANILTKEFEFLLNNASGYYTYKVSAEKIKPLVGKLIIE
ncbi:MAG: T9SS type A sorting domain-containing protein, partial [Bacteroidia bacterium]